MSSAVLSVPTPWLPCAWLLLLLRLLGELKKG